MPPEPLPPWDRKEVFKERKHERSEPSPVGFNQRWRDSSSGHHGSSRWNGGSSDFRRPPGHGKQGGWHMFLEENGHGYPPFQSSDKILEDQNFRPLVPRGEGKYGRNGRENKGYRDLKGGYSGEMNSSPSTPWRLHDMNNDQRLADDVPMDSSLHPPRSDFVNNWDLNHLKEQHDGNKTGGINGLGTGQKGDREDSLDWKPLKWTRSGSLSSRGSGFSHSSSSKSLGGADSNEKAELLPKNMTLIQSPTGDAAACGTLGTLLEETSSRKKPRLGWGEGLAKYEKKKVDVLDMSVNKDGTFVSSINAEPIHSQSSNIADKSPRVMGTSDCASPATPSSVACSSSSGLEEKAYGKAVNVDKDISNLYGSPSVGSQCQLEGFCFNLEKLDTSSIANMGSSLIELLQSDDISSVDSSFVRSTTLNKLLVLKGDISKALEITESEIDLLENELKLLNFESGSSCPCLAASTFPAEDNAEPFNELGALSNICQPSPLDVAACEDEIVGVIPDCIGALQENRACSKDDDTHNSTPEILESACIMKAVSSSSIVKHGEGTNALDAVQSDAELKCSVLCTNGEETAVSDISRDVSMLAESKNCPPFSGDVSSQTDGEDIICEILASNKDSAGKASEVFIKLLCRDQCKMDVSRVAADSPWQNDALMKEKFNMRKRFSIFKEKVVYLKFKAFQHLWKEDMHLLSIRKFRAKSQKKYELSLRATYSGHQKHRSSVRSRVSSPARNLGLLPATELFNFTGKPLSVSQPRRYRNTLKMPALILDEKEKIVSRFISSNGLVEDPWAVEKERASINPWTSEEREVFMDKMAMFGKDFQKIASFLDHKTTADCVEFYYKNHKSDCFNKIKMGKESKSSTTNYLVSSGKKWNCAMNAASLDILGAASVMAADTDSATRSRPIRSGRIFMGSYRDPKLSQVHDGLVERSSKLDALGNEKETIAADVLARICGSVSSEFMGSCITTSVDSGEGYWEQKCQNMVSVMKHPRTTDVMQNVDDETCSDDSCEEMDSTDWTDEEKSLFVQAVSSYGKDFAMISQCVRTRSRDQCKVFFSKARKCLGLDLMHPGRQGTPMSDDVDGGGSDTEGGYAFKTNSVTYGDKLGSKTDEELSLHVVDGKQDDSHSEEGMAMSTVLNVSEANNAGCLLDQKDSKVVETFALDARQREPMPGLVDDRKILNGIHQLKSIQTQRVPNESMHFEAERDQANGEGSSMSEGMSVHLLNPVVSNLATVIKVNDKAQVSANEIGNDGEGQCVLTDNSLAASRSDFVQDSSLITTSNHLPVDMGSCSSSSLQVENLRKVSMDLDSVGNSVLFQSHQENNTAMGNSESQDSTSIQCGKLNDRDGPYPALDHEEGIDKRGKNSVSNGHNLQQLTGHPLSNHEGHLPTKREMNGDISCIPLSVVQSLSDLESNSQHLAQDCHLQKCNCSSVLPLVPECSVLSKVSEQTNEQHSSQSLSNTEERCRNGDVKLFGQILSNSSSQIPNPSSHEGDERSSNHPKPSSVSSILKFSSRSADGNTALLQFDGNNNYCGLENVPMRSYGFWDGNRIQTGYSSLPDSAVLLAKYPAAFSNYHASSSKMEQHALQGAVKSNERSSNGISVFPPRETNGSNGLVDYQMYKSHDGSKMQPFTVDMKQKVQPFMMQRQGIYSELQKRNGFEAISGVQQQGRVVMPGMNVVGRGGILVGGPCGGFSDPVAAIKMHFSQPDQYGMQNGNIIREEESWRGSNGDIGR